MLGNCFNLYISNSDEMINFLNIYKMANGIEIYKDINVIITPLFFYIGEYIFNIFGSNVLVFRIYNLILLTIMYLLCYVILKKLKIRKNLALMYTLLILMFTNKLGLGGTNYNILSFVFFELGILSLLKYNNNEKTKNKYFDKIQKNIDMVQGLILFLVIFSNHKLGFGYFLGLIVYYLIFSKKKKEAFTSISKVILINCMLFSIYAIYLYLNNNLYNFINYTILGIIEFGSKNTHAGIQDVINTILYISIWIITIITNIVVKKALKKAKNNNNNEEENNKIKEYCRNSSILLIFSISSIVLVIPILNEYHSILCTIIFLINIMYSINFLVMPILEGKKLTKIIIILNLAIILFTGIKSIKDINIYISEMKKIPKESHFYGGVIEENLENQIKEVTKYIKNQKENENRDVIILSTYAPIYSIELNDLKNGVYDWALRGNLGKDGEEGLINKIKELKNTQILLLDETEDSKEIYQFAYDAKEYIENNMKYIGKIQNFNIYQTID